MIAALDPTMSCFDSSAHSPKPQPLDQPNPCGIGKVYGCSPPGWLIQEQPVLRAFQSCSCFRKETNLLEPKGCCGLEQGCSSHLIREVETFGTIF